MSFLILDDDASLARSFERALRPLRPLVVARSAAEADALVASCATWTAFFVDLHHEDAQPGGLDFLARARAALPHVPAAIVADRPDPALINRAYALGATFLCRPCPPEHLTAFASRAVVHEIVRSESVTRVVADLATQFDLSLAETELLAFAVLGMQRGDLPRARGVSPNTLKTQVRTLLAKAGAKDLDRLALQILRNALGTPDPDEVRRLAAVARPPSATDD